MTSANVGQEKRFLIPAISPIALEYGLEDEISNLSKILILGCMILGLTRLPKTENIYISIS
jgi:hypothetical protein